MSTARDEKGRFSGGETKLVEPLFVRLESGLRTKIQAIVDDSGLSLAQWINSTLIASISSKNSNCPNSVVEAKPPRTYLPRIRF